MLTPKPRFRLRLLGPFGIENLDGARINVPSKKGVALIAMLATARNGERARGWLQTKLWGSRQQHEGRGSLRRELSDLRKRLNVDGVELIISERDRCRLNLDALDIDILDDERTDGAPMSGEFLEGLDIPGEEAFEDWLREERAALAARSKTFRAAVNPTKTRLDGARPPREFPSLAVMRFADLTGDPAKSYVAEGVGQELINDLSRLKWLPVIAGGSSAAQGNGDSHVDARSLGASYLLDGAVRDIDGALLIDATLWDGARRHALWSKRVTLTPPIAQAALAECLTELVAHLSAKIDHGEQIKARGRTSQDPTASDLIWRGRWHLNQLRHGDVEAARDLFAQALTLDPESSEARILMTHATLWLVWTGRYPASDISEIRKQAQSAMLADPEDGRGYWLAGTAETWLRHPVPALALLREAVELNPSLAIAHAQLGCTLTLDERPDEGRGHLNLARRLSPFDVHLFFVFGELSMNASLRNSHREAVDFADLSIARRHNYWYPHMLKVDALYRLGDRPAATRAMRELLELKPNFSKRYLEWIPFVDRRRVDHFHEGIAALGGPAEDSAPG